MKDRTITLPNLLTLLRILLIPFFLWSILQANFLQSLLIFFIAGITDCLDGQLARRLNQHSELGQRLDPIADKLLLSSTYIVLTLPGYGYQPVPLWLTIPMLVRDLAILIAAVVIERRTGFRDFKPSQPGKWHTTVLLITALAFLATHSLGRYTEYLGVFYGLSLMMTVFSGLHYIYFINRALAEYRGTTR
ncbi:MAG: CDP-alcohol phosphatidyltransferase family protein [Acidobacteriota bacterium]